MGNIYPHEQGGFDDDEACACGNEHWIAYWVATQEVKMISDTARVSLNILRGFLVAGTLGLLAKPLSVGQDITHEAVKVKFNCTRCRRVIAMTYEIFTEGVTGECCGGYTRVYETSRSHDINLTYATIKLIFDQQPKSYNFMYNNCKKWSPNLFYDIVKANNSK